MNRQIVLMLLMAMRFCTRVHAGILSTQSGVEPGVGREPPADSLRKTVGTGTKDIAGALVDPGTKGKTVSTNLGSQVDPGIAGSNSSDGQQWPRTAPVNAEGAADLRAMDVSGQGIYKFQLLIENMHVRRPTSTASPINGATLLMAPRTSTGSRSPVDNSSCLRREARADICLSGTERHKVNDTHCGTYIQCKLEPGSNSYTSEKRCCKSLFEFDRTSHQCVRSRGISKCNPNCLPGYTTDCHLYPAKGNLAAYITEGNTGNTTMSCPPGTQFSMELCGCGLHVMDTPGNVCNIQLGIQFHYPIYKTYGSERMIYIKQKGRAEKGSAFKGQATYHFNGNLLFKVDYFKQALPELFLQVDFLPANQAAETKFILVSNCKQVTGLSHSGGKPSLEVTLESGFVHFHAQTSRNRLELRVLYQVKLWNQFKVMYDGTRVVISNEAEGAWEQEFDSGSLSGAIEEAEEGIEIGSCETKGNRGGFEGDVAKIAVSKCLTQEQREFVKRINPPTGAESGPAARRARYDKAMREALEYVSRNETLVKLYMYHTLMHKRVMDKFFTESKTRAASFTCADNYTATPSPPNSVHELRPEHISVVAALGDSLTAGNCLLESDITKCYKEHRGRAWSIGGDLSLEQGVKTLPNLLRKFNSGLKGYSVGICGSKNVRCSQLNVAEAGAAASDLPGQADELIKRMRSRSDIDMNSDWKLITIFVGGNDLCSHCTQTTMFSAENFKRHIATTLDKLKANIPRAFVNLVQIINMSPLAKIQSDVVCSVVTTYVCECKKEIASMAQMSRAYQRELESLINSGRYDDKIDFTVVLQPFFEETKPTLNPDGSYSRSWFFGPDCFHFSAIGSSSIAKSLWNNMIEPVGCKQKHLHLFEPFKCPHTHGVRDGVFRTKQNTPPSACSKN